MWEAEREASGEEGQGRLFEGRPPASPFLKWAGGKQALAGEVLRRFPKDFDRYFEPFLGGGSIFFALAPPRAVLGDGNAWLLDTYEAVRDDWRAVAERLDRMANTRDEYLRIRARPPESLAPPLRAAQFIYLNKTGFRGLFRVNGDGRFNVPWGAYRRRTYDPEVLAAAAAALRGVELRRGDFESGLEGVMAKDFVYLDPPYHRIGGFSDFNRYTGDKFKEADHERLAARCRALDAAGVRFVLSNSETPFIRGLYAGFRIECIAARREINLDSSKRDLSELLISNV